MKRFYVATTLLSTVLLASMAVFAQAQSREDKLKELEAKREELAALEQKLLAPSDEAHLRYADFLKLPDTGLIRLLPREKYDRAAYPATTTAPATPGSFPRKALSDLSSPTDQVELSAGQAPRGGGGVPRQNDNAVTNLADLPRLGDPYYTGPARPTVAIRGGGAYYSFIRKTHEYGSSDIQLDHGELSSGFAGANYGLLKNIGDVPLESVDLNTRAAQTLNAYTPPTQIAAARVEQRRFGDGADIDGLTFKDSARLKLHSTYLLRSVNYAFSDVLVAFKVVDIDSDGSAIILWKLLQKYPVPILAQK